MQGRRSWRGSQIAADQLVAFAAVAGLDGAALCMQVHDPCTAARHSPAQMWHVGLVRLSTCSLDQRFRWQAYVLLRVPLLYCTVDPHGGVAAHSAPALTRRRPVAADRSHWADARRTAGAVLSRARRRRAAAAGSGPRTGQPAVAVPPADGCCPSQAIQRHNAQASCTALPMDLSALLLCAQQLNSDDIAVCTRMPAVLLLNRARRSSPASKPSLPTLVCTARLQRHVMRCRTGC